MFLFVLIISKYAYDQLICRKYSGKSVEFTHISNGKNTILQIAEAGADKLIDKAKDYIIQKAEKFNFSCIKETYDYCQISPMKHPKKFYDCAVSIQL